MTETGMRLLFAIAALFVSLVVETQAAEHKVMIATWRGCEEACQGFQDYFSENGVDAEFILRDAAQNMDALPGFLAEARANNVDLIISWGTSVTRGIAGTLSEVENQNFNHEISQVFMIVADPVGAGLIKSLDETGRMNLTGTYNRVPEEVNIDTIRSYMPEFKRLGMLYNVDEKNSILKRDEVAKLADSMGIELVSVELPLDETGKPSTDDIGSKMAELKAAGAEFLYLGSSSFLQNNGDAVTSEALANSIPVLSPYEQLVRESNALISVAARYYDVGRLAGEQAKKILDGANPGELPVLRMTNFAVVINMDVARNLKLFPPLDLLQVAETVN